MGSYSIGDEIGITYKVTNTNDYILFIFMDKTADTTLPLIPKNRLYMTQ